MFTYILVYCKLVHVYTFGFCMSNPQLHISKAFHSNSTGSMLLATMSNTEPFDGSLFFLRKRKV